MKVKLCRLILLTSVLLPFGSITAYGFGINDNKGSLTMNLLDGESRLITDQVMGGVSNGHMGIDQVHGVKCLRLRGTVSTLNNGGFIQIAFDLERSGIPDLTAYAGVKLRVSGNQERYNVHLRTANLWFPWQSYRASFAASADWQDIVLPFDSFEGYKTTRSLNLSKLERVAIVAIGRDFDADLCVSDIHFYRD